MYEPSVPNQRLYTLRRPLGVVGLITPWNFPIAIPVWKMAPALIYGNTVVLKLGYEAPRTGLHVAEAFAEAGLPAGVLNVLTGSGSTVGAELVNTKMPSDVAELPSPVASCMKKPLVSTAVTTPVVATV